MPPQPASLLGVRGIGVRRHVGPNAFGNALGNSLAEMNWGGSQQEQALGSGLKVRSDIWGSTASYGDYSSADLSLTANGTPRLPTQMGDVSAGTQNALHLTDEDWAAIPPLTQKLPDPVQVAGLGDLKGILTDAYRKGKEIVTDSAKGIGMMLNDALVRPSGSTDEIPQRRFTPTPSSAVNVPRLDVSGTGQSLVAGGGSPMFTANQSPYFGTPEYQIARGVNEGSLALGLARSSMLLGSGVAALFDGNYSDGGRDLALGGIGIAGVRGSLSGTNAISRTFKVGEDVAHFEKHGSEIAQTLGYGNYSLSQYVQDANSVIRNGTFVPELNAYVAIPGGAGSAKGLLVGLDRATGEITTMHMKPISWFETKAPSLGWQAQPKSVRTDTVGSNPQNGWKWPY